MKSINRVTFLGHVVADPEIKVTKNNKSVCHFAIATNNEWFDSEGVLQKSVDFHRVTAWESLAELCAKYLKKGSPLYVEGRLVNRSYEGQNNIRHFITEVIANNIHLLQWQAQKQGVETQELAAV